jgi:mono/diheme cytochrome c family protein
MKTLHLLSLCVGVGLLAACNNDDGAASNVVIVASDNPANTPHWRDELTPEQAQIADAIFADPHEKPPFLVVPLEALTSEKTATEAASIERGHEVYQLWCSACHGFGQHTPGTMALFFKYEGKIPAPLEMRRGLNAQTLDYFIRNGISMMPSFRPTEISDSDIQAMADYLAESSAFFAKQAQAANQ